MMASITFPEPISGGVIWDGWSFLFFMESSDSVTCTSILSCVLLWKPMDCSSPDSSVHGIFQPRILQCVAISYSRRTSSPRDGSQVSCHGRRILYHWATWEVPVTWVSFFLMWHVVSSTKAIQLSQIAGFSDNGKKLTTLNTEAQNWHWTISSALCWSKPVTNQSRFERKETHFSSL